jgi:hypothetical protein
MSFHGNKIYFLCYSAFSKYDIFIQFLKEYAAFIYPEDRGVCSSEMFFYRTPRYQNTEDYSMKVALSFYSTVFKPLMYFYRYFCLSFMEEKAVQSKVTTNDFLI